MNTSTYRTELTQSNPTNLRATRGTIVTCVAGEVWLTIDGHPEDIILEPGQTYVFGCRANAFIAAFAPATAEWSIVRNAPLRALGEAVEHFLVRLAQSMTASKARMIAADFRLHGIQA